jgi:hypothetical protein
MDKELSCKKKPWQKSYYNAKHRCLYGKYKKYNRQFKMTMGDFEYLWHRDNAHLMKQPSIDRIDNDGDYILNNCRFIEKSENSRRANLGSVWEDEIKKKMSDSHNKCPVKQLSLDGKLIKIFPSIISTKEVTHYTNVARALSGLRPTAGGYKWERVKN